MQLIPAQQIAPPFGICSHAVVNGNFVYCSGQLPIDANGNLVAGGIANQVQKIFENIIRQLRAFGSSLRHVMKVSIFMTDLGDLVEMNLVYNGYFGRHAPAQTTVQVISLPLDASVEIDVVAILAGSY